MVRFLAGIGLLLVSAFMLLGFVLSTHASSIGATIAAIGIAVVLPAAAGIALVRGGPDGGKSKRKELLRRQTLESEVLRLAARERGRLTAVDVAMELALAPDDAKALLDSLVTREVADIAVSETGVLVYTFPIARLSEKERAKDVLDD